MRFPPSGSDHLHYHRALLDLRILRIPRPHPARLAAPASCYGRREAPLERVCRRVHRTHYAGGVECVRWDFLAFARVMLTLCLLDGTRSA